MYSCFMLASACPLASAARRVAADVAVRAAVRRVPQIDARLTLTREFSRKSAAKAAPVTSLRVNKQDEQMVVVSPAVQLRTGRRSMRLPTDATTRVLLGTTDSPTRDAAHTCARPQRREPRSRAHSRHATAQRGSCLSPGTRATDPVTECRNPFAPVPCDRGRLSYLNITVLVCVACGE